MHAQSLSVSRRMEATVWKIFCTAAGTFSDVVGRRESEDSMQKRKQREERRWVHTARRFSSCVGSLLAWGAVQIDIPHSEREQRSCSHLLWHSSAASAHAPAPQPLLAARQDNMLRC